MAALYVALYLGGGGGGIWDVAAYSQAQADRHYYCTTVLAANDIISDTVIELHEAPWSGMLRQASPKDPESCSWSNIFLFSITRTLNCSSASSDEKV